MNQLLDAAELERLSDSEDYIHTKQRISELIGSGIFEWRNAKNIFRESAFIEVMICLRDLLAKVEKYDKRIDFDDDVAKNEYVKDITGLVEAIRDACCHIKTHKRQLGGPGSRGAFNTAWVKVILGNFNGVELRNDYDDDIAIFYGPNRIYVNRHIRRVFAEAVRRLEPVLSRPRFSFACAPAAPRPDAHHRAGDPQTP
jgi:hypothetical protein